jgi:spore germination cell wall hydrolase CwlJ-like protein
MTWTYWEWALLSLMIWREARNQGETGMAAVGWVAWNRHVESGKPLGLVITEDAQFTSINPYKKTYDSQLDVWPSPTDVQFQDAMRIANEIMGATSNDPTGGATFYRNPATATSHWFQSEIVDSGKYFQSAVIGAHEFYARRKLGGITNSELWGEA